MLPARNPNAGNLAEVLESCLAATTGKPNALGFSKARTALVIVIDGLGAKVLQRFAGHARTLASAAKRSIPSGFPTTTASALTSLTTGTLPGAHGIVGYDVRIPESGVVQNQLRDWRGPMDPALWQRSATVFERHPDATVVIAETKFSQSGFTQASYRGAKYVGGINAEERCALALEAVRSSDTQLVYLYFPELDRLGHEHGVASDHWISELERLDALLGELFSELPSGTGVVVTADHGMIDIDESAHVIVPSDSPLLHHVDVVAGEPRCLQIHRSSEASDEEWSRTKTAWLESESHRAWVFDREELIESGWLGEVHETVEQRLGDLWVAAREPIAYYFSETAKSRGMVGQHGSLTEAELRVPLLLFGAFATQR
ncbi:alkaline phosphatase family protein [Humidisolicoccus flavus]|uniref:alkaline phosphatase family protein n=1 Tax=Humidisolicoccus flavus TaxID=3111414 RepID=UPI0032528875